MNFFKKWYTYQKERFPVLTYGIYIMVIVIGTFCICNKIQSIMVGYAMEHYNYLTHISINSSIQWIRILPMFIVAFLQFLMVRIIDEFKDYEEDCKYRSYRPVPRGLITLKELKVLFIICAITQVVITLCINVNGIIWLAILWVFFAIMSKSFFMKKILDKHILLEVTLDEIMMPILVLYLSYFVIGEFGLFEKTFYSTSCGLLLGNYLLIAYTISWIVEVARKIRCKDDEEKGVKTYTAVFGIGGAVLLLSTLETILTILQLFIMKGKMFDIILGLYIVVGLINLLFFIRKNKICAKITALSANLFVILAYVSMLALIL